MRALLLGLFSLLLLSLGCGEVEKCARGAPGCLAGPPKAGKCEHGLVLMNGACTEPGASPAALSCLCEDGQVCTPDEYRCVDYCAPLDVEIGTQPARVLPTCKQELSVEQLCENRCLIRCKRWQELCPSSGGCSPEACKSREERAACQTECGADANPARCMAQACTEALSRGCNELTCPDQKQPDCQNLQCRNSCPGFNFDGVCDDGELKSAAFGVCAYGTDCADCGPRRNPVPKPGAIGEACAFHSGCAGANVDDIADALAWCIEVAPGISRCAPDCSSPDRVCPEGSSCFTLSGIDQDGDGQPDPIQRDGRVASACFPSNMCR